MIECTDVEFLPADKRARIDALGGRAHLPQRLEQLARQLGISR
jgi:hypothetical protein